VVGLTAALLGAHVVLTDLPAVLPGLRRNVEVPLVREIALLPAMLSKRASWRS